MDVLSRIVAWLSDHEAAISAVAAIIGDRRVVFAGVRWLLSRTAVARLLGEGARCPPLSPLRRAKTPQPAPTSIPSPSPASRAARPSRCSRSTTSPVIPTRSTSRWDRGGSDHRLSAWRTSRHRPQFELHLQGQGRGCEAGQPRTRALATSWRAVRRSDGAEFEASGQRSSSTPPDGTHHVWAEIATTGSCPPGHL